MSAAVGLAGLAAPALPVRAGDAFHPAHPALAWAEFADLLTTRYG